MGTPEQLDEIAQIAQTMVGRVIEDVRIRPDEGEMHIELTGGRVIVVCGAFIIGSCVPAASYH